MSWQPIADQRIVAGLPATLRWQATDGDGLPVDPGTVTVTVTAADGTVLVSAASTSGTGTDERTYPLAAADNPQVDQLTVTWSGTLGAGTTVVDVAGASLLTVAEIRSYEPSLVNAYEYPDAVLIAARRDVEQFIERDDRCNQSFVPTLRSMTKNSPGQQAITLDRPNLIEMRSVTPTGVTVADIPPNPDGIAYTNGTEWFPCGATTFVFVHGFASPPRDIKRAAARMVRQQLLGGSNGSAIPENAISWSRPDGMGTTTLAVPGLREWTTGIPWVDEILQANTWKPTGVG